jgi:hypothetical protein
MVDFSLVVTRVDRQSLHRIVRSDSTGTTLEGGPRVSGESPAEDLTSV